jgi:branched-chain amino acid transport system substrate-binding protein
MKKNSLFLMFFFTFSALADENTIKLGATLPLSGNLATYGNLIRGGIELAVEDQKALGVSVEAYFDDTPFSGSGVISSLRKLASVDKVDAITGNFSNVAMALMAPELQKLKLPTFHTAAADNLIYDSNDWVLTTNIKIPDEAAEMARVVFEKFKMRRVAVLFVQTNFGDAYHQAFVENFKKLGGEITTIQNFEISATDSRAQLTKIRATKPDGVFFGAFGPFLGFSLKQARELGIKCPFFSVYESEDTSVLDSAGVAANGLYYLVTSSITSSEKFHAYRDRYFAKYHLEPGTFGANAYDAATLMTQALKKCNRDRECTKNELYQIKDFEGVSGSFSIAADGAARKKFVLRTIEDGKFVDAQ